MKDTHTFFILILIQFLAACETMLPVADKAVFWKDLQEKPDSTDLFTEEERQEMRRIEMVRRGKTPLMAAIEKHDFEEVKRLVAGGAHINVSDNSGLTALHYAVRDCNITVAYYLLDHGASIYSRDVAGRTLMHFAALSNCGRMVRAAHNRGLEPDIRDKYGRTALMLAAENYHADVIESFLRIDANVAIRDHRGKTALYIAAEQIDFYEEPPEEEPPPQIPRVRATDSWPVYIRRPVQYVADMGTSAWDSVISYDYSKLNPFRVDPLPPDNIRTFILLLDADASLNDMDYSYKSVYDVIMQRGDPEILELIQEYR